MSAEPVRLAEARKLTLGWEPISTLLSDPGFAPLVLTHHQEMMLLPEEAMPMRVDWATLLGQERSGALRVWVARVAGELAGFIAFNIHVHPFYMLTARAFADIWCVSSKYRGKGVLARRLWESALVDLKGFGIKAVLGHDNQKRSEEAFFDGLDFEPAGTVYIRAL